MLNQKTRKKPDKAETTDIQELGNRFFKSRSSEDFGKLYFRVKAGLRKHILGIVGTNDNVDIVESSILEKVWKNIDKYDPEKAKFSTWLYSIAKNESLQFMDNLNKEHERIVSVDMNEMYDSTLMGPNSQAVTWQDDTNGLHVVNGVELEFATREDVMCSLVDASRTCIEKLPDNYRLILTEKLFKKKTIDEIANETGIRKTSVVNWLRKGRLQLAELLKTNYSNLYEEYLIALGE